MKDKLKKFFSKQLFLALALGAVGIYFFQLKVVMPMVYDVVSSDAFLVDSKDVASALPISTPLTTLAFNHCNDQIKTQLGSEVAIKFPAQPINSWSLGNYQYVVNAEIDVTRNGAATEKKKYACRINYTKGDDTSGVNDVSNWSIDGISGLDKS